MREQRRYHRVRPNGPARAGSIFVDLKKPVIGCNVVDISAGGACIEVHGIEAIRAVHPPSWRRQEILPDRLAEGPAYRRFVLTKPASCMIAICAE
jgi:hypothetical protein